MVKRFLATCAALVMTLPAALAATVISGQVERPDGEPAYGAMVRIQQAEQGLSETVYVNAAGEFRLDTELTGPLTLRVRAPYMQDSVQSLNGGSSDKPLQITLQPLATDAAISETLEAVFHFGNIPFDKDGLFSRTMFQRDCSGCHALGTALTRIPRPPEGWVPTITRMHSYLGHAGKEEVTERAARLSKGFDGKPLAIRPDYDVDAEILSAKVYEYALPGIIFPHDSEISHDDDLAYTVDRHGDKMIITDLKSGASTYIDQPLSTREYKPDANTYTGRSSKPGPHSLALGDDSLWYTTNATSSEIGVFDASTREWLDTYALPMNGHYPHTIRIDKSNIVWFTVAASEHIGRLDPKSGEMVLLDSPNPRPIGIPASTSPYGIDIHPHNGQVWYARLFGDRIGYVDPETLEVFDFESPVAGPRRLRFDAQGTLWLTGYSNGEIVRIDTKTMESKVYAMPELAPGYPPAPYALGVHPQTQEIWVNDTLTDRVYRFLPEEERFIPYPMPLRGTYTRDFSFTKDGWACTANSPIMNAALEEGVAGLICIDTDGAES